MNALAHFEHRQQDGVEVLTFTDRRIKDEAQIQAMGGELFEFVDGLDTGQKVILSLQRVEFMSSAAFGKLLTFAERARAKDISFKIVDTRGEVYGAMQISGVNNLLDIAPDQTEVSALALFT